MIKINGKYIRNIPEQVGKNKRDIFQLDTDLTALEVKVNEALAGVFHYKGSVATYADLPASDNEVGDVYNVIDTGKNYAWDGSSWDDLGGLVDLSNYVTLDSDQTITSYKYFSNAGGISSVKYNGAEYGSLNLHGDEGVYVTTGSSYRFVDVQGNLDPNADNTYDLGSSHTWKDLYLAGNIKIGNFDISPTDSNELRLLRANSAFLRIQNSVIMPYTTNFTDLGNSTHAWKDLYLSGKVIANDIASTDVLQLGKNGYIIYARGGISPLANGTRDLGGSSFKWRDLYLSGNISNGTDSVTVADLAALITYAKGQGWIS